MLKRYLIAKHFIELELRKNLPQWQTCMCNPQKGPHCFKDRFQSRIASDLDVQSPPDHQQTMPHTKCRSA